MKRYLNRIFTAESAPYHCLCCGRELHWSGDFKRSEITDEDDDSDVGIWFCECGKDYEVFSLSENELDSFGCDEEEDPEPERRQAGVLHRPLEHDFYVQAVLKVFCIDFDTLVGARRVRNYVMAREAVAHYLMVERGCSVARVGELLGGRRPATAFHLLKLYGQDLQYDPKFRNNMDAVNKLIQNEG